MSLSLASTAAAAPTTVQPSFAPAAAAQGDLDRVRHIARRLARRLPPGVDVDELVSAGLVGLAEAVRRRDEARATAFGFFADLRTRGAMLDYLRQLDPRTRAERQVARRLGALRDATRVREGREPTAEEEQAVCGDVEVAPLSPVPVDIEIAERTHPDAFEGESPEDALLRRERAERARAALASLQGKEAEVMRLLYEEGLSLKEAGARLGVTESRACQLRTRAIARMREALSE